MKLKHVKTAQYKWQVVFFTEKQRKEYNNFWFVRVIEGETYLSRARKHLRENNVEYSESTVLRQGPTFKFKRKNDAVWFMMYQSKFFNINNLQDPHI